MWGGGDFKEIQGGVCDPGQTIERDNVRHRLDLGAFRLESMSDPGLVQAKFLRNP